MVYSGIFCTENDVKYKAGSGVNAAAVVEAYLNSFVAQAESRINNICRYNFSDKYAGLNVDVKEILREAASCIAAIYCITYDMSGYSTINEAGNMINLYRDIILTDLSLLRDQKVVTFINDA